MSREHRWRAWIGAFAVCSVTAVFVAASARAEDAGTAPPPDAGADGAPEEASPDPRTAKVRALVAGTLAVTEDAQALFDVPLDDEEALRIDAVRVRALLRTVEESAQPAPKRSLRPTPVDGGTTREDIESIDPVRWAARVDLDRARLEFYALPRDKRAELLRDLEARREAAKPKETEEQRHARVMEEERQRTLEAARRARSDAERLVNAEMARLIGLEGAVERAEQHTTDERAALTSLSESVLGWQRRAKDAKAATAADADATYDALRQSLRTSRDDLDGTLDDLTSSESRVPELGPDPLTDIPPDISTTDVRRRRARISKLVLDAQVAERAMRDERALALLNGTNALNLERLGLIPYLSAEKRAAITGFTEGGLAQAQSEARQLGLILRYHRHVVSTWFSLLRQKKGVQGLSFWGVALVAVPWLVLFAVFSWLRRRSAKLLALLHKRVLEQERAERRGSPSLGLRAVQYLKGVHGPLEWLLLFGASVWLLPASTRGLLEVELLVVIVGWTLGGSFLVDLINALAAATDPTDTSASKVGQLRLRSLRLVGRVVVLFALILVLSPRLVGQGTVYSWVLSTCWFAALPLFLVLVRWWRETVFERVERVRRKSPLESWVLANRKGWKSFVAAMIAAVHLFVTGSYKTVRNWLSGFDLARRALAYLFKRQLDKLSDADVVTELQPIDPAAFLALAPDRIGEGWIEGSGEPWVRTVFERQKAGAGGVIAVVGARGLGKTSLFTRVARDVPGALVLTCDGQTSAKSLLASLDELGGSPAIVLLDEAQALVRPVLGGLRAFDEVLALARSGGTTCLWVFAIDSAVWPFLMRARDARPIFDEVTELEPWTDLQIGALLTSRCAEAGISPTFEDLLEKLPPSADEVDKQEALDAKRAGYFRMVWDYARGNPGMALEVWRSSLAAEAGNNVRVRALQAPKALQLETLPDNALFILRAVLQTAPASPEDIAAATRLTEAQVQNAFRFGCSHGYLVEEAGKVRVSWTWLRAITLLLERRHLLVGSW